MATPQNKHIVSKRLLVHAKINTYRCSFKHMFTGSTAFTPSGQAPFMARLARDAAMNGPDPDGVNAVLPSQALDMQNKPEYTRFLPHYHPVGATFFVTFRLHGSLPKVFLEELSAWHVAEKERIFTLRPGEEIEKALVLLQRDYFRKYDAALDQCLCGPVFLKDPAVAQHVVDQLVRFDGQWYRLDAYTLMPNHVHALLDFSIQVKPGEAVNMEHYKNLDYIMDRVKGASARYANLTLKHTGETFWQPEYHDRYIRDKRHLLAAIDYIKQNVVSAKICAHWREHAFTWVREDFW
jgi:putative transposase